jgi:hypothetical protein
MMQLPKELQGLEEPKFIMVTPAVVQCGFLITILLTATSVFAWIGYSLLTGAGITGIRVGLGAIMLLGFVVALNRRNWQRWAYFACDHNGVYLRKRNYQYLFKPWKDVGGFYKGVAYDGDGRSKAVIARVRISEEEWRDLFGIDPGRKIDEDGYSHFGISGGFMSLDDVLESVERVRILSGGWSRPLNDGGDGTRNGHDIQKEGSKDG